MFKMISHALMLLVGASIGVWWGVYHPVAANDLVQKEQADIAAAKVEVLKRIKGDPTPQNIDQTLNAEQEHLQQVKQD